MRALILIGEQSDALESERSSVRHIEKEETMQSAVNAAKSVADPGDIVLLSPGCKSFDMFDDYEHRGNVFKEAVRRLQEG